MKRRVCLVVPIVLVLLCLAGCAEPPAAAPPAAAVPSAGTVAATSDLAPTFRADGTTGTVPEQVLVELPSDVFSYSSWGENAPAGTVLAVDPPLSGTLRVQNLSTLAFRPSAGFAPGTRYTFELQSLETEDGVVRPDDAGAWRYELQVPDFAFVRFGLADVDAGDDRIVVEIVFSGPVDPAAVRRRARLQVIDPSDGRSRVLSASFSAAEKRHVVHASIPSRGLLPGGRLELVLDEGVASATHGDLRAAGATASIHFGRQPPLLIVDLRRLEADSGFFLRVLCDDKSVENRLGFWDDESNDYRQLSQRCIPDEDAAREKIRFEPAVDFSVAPGRGGFRIFGDFKRGSYKLSIARGLTSIDGGELASAFETRFDVPARRPSLAFVSQGRYLPRSAWQLLPLRHTNVEQARLVVRHVPPENLVFWMSDDESEAAGERTSNLIESRTLPLRGADDVETTSYVDLGSVVPASTRGLLELGVRAGAAHDTARVLLTDLHLVAKRSGDGSLRVWALDMHSLKPQSGVEMRLIRKSGFSLATCTTGGQGACTLVPEAARDPDPSPPFALVAQRHDDLTYLKLSELKAEVQETRIAGEPYRGGRKYRAALYGERGVYRPGETAHLAAIVRGEDNLAPPAGMPVQAKLVDPRGITLRRATLTTNEAGYVTLDHEFPAFATTGRYEVHLEAADVRIGGHSFQVEEFVPERMKVETAPSGPAYLLGETKQIEVAARYLFGGVPAEHRVELRCDLEPATFEPTENANFHYGVWGGDDAPSRGVALGTASGVLDADGRTRLTCPGSAAGGFSGPARLVARAAVFEAGSGRTTVGRADVPVHPAAFYVGLSSGAAKVRAGDELVVDGVTVDWQGRLVTDVAEVEVELVRVETEWGWYFDESRGHWTSRHVERPVTAERATARPAAGKFRVSFKPSADAASFLVRARAGAARTDLELEGRGSWFYRAPEEGDRTPAPGRPNWIALDVPRKSGVGEKIEVSFEAPYPGRVLFTAETDEILGSEWKKVDSGRVSWSYKPHELVSNIYLTAFLVKDPHLDSEQAFLPERSFGVASVRLEPVELTHPLQLEAPEEVRSNSRLTVELDLGQIEGSTYATVAAVDEGILSLTNFQSPDPFPAIFTRRALGVETFETVGWTLLVPPAGPTSTAGGDAGGGLGRVQPVRPVALWAGLVEVPESGKVEVGFDVPRYRGALRVMAVSAGPKKMGHASTTVLVRDPLVVQATLPRFLTRGDDVRVPVFVTNVSGERRDVDVEIQVTAAPVPGFDVGGEASLPVEILGDRTTGFALADGGGDTAVFRLVARQPVGAARVKVVVRSGDVRVEEEADVPLLPAGPKTRRVERIELGEGETDLTPHLEGWVPLSERTTFWVTNQPYADALGHVDHLLRYPYGCIEQTTSTTRPLLYLAELLPTIAPDLVAGSTIETPTIEDLAQRGIARILSMQTPSGGFAYWPGGTESTYWGTAYATHLLLDARKERYSVAQESLDEALSWMERQVTHHYETGQHRNDWYSQDAEPYIHYVLALGGRARKARIERLVTELGGPPSRRPRSGRGQESLFMLQAALYVAGDQRYEANLKSPDVSPVADERSNGWSFYSDRRRRGFMLATFVDLFGNDPAGERLANLVAEGLRGRRSAWYTTQELVWGITGLGKYSPAGTSDYTPPVLRADGREVEPAPNPAGRSTSDRTWNVARASEYGEVTIDVSRKGEGKLYLVMTSQGVREAGEARFGGEGLMLTRRYRTASGEPVDFTTHRLGELVYVELTLTNTSPERIANVALVDRVPAAWEIENPRLGRGSTPSWVASDQLWEMDHLDLRDDRLEVFGHLDKGGSRVVVYAVRAVTAGRFTVPSVEAEAMYDPRIWARQRGREIFVNGPWLGEVASAKEGMAP